MACMTTSAQAQDGEIRTISEQEWNERRKKELFPDDLCKLSL